MQKKGGTNTLAKQSRRYLKPVISLVSSDEIDMQAGCYKCARSISLVDCYVLAVAKIQNVPAVFARREEDLENELQRRPFDVKPLFLEDFPSSTHYF